MNENKHPTMNHRRHIKYNNISKQEALKLVAQDAYLLEDMSAEMQNDYEVVKMAVENKPYAFGSASENLRNNSEIALIAVKGKSTTIRYIGDKLKTNRSFWKDAYTISKDIAQFIEDEKIKEEITKTS